MLPGGAINKAYGIKGKVKAVPFANMVEAYLKWSKENKTSWETDFYRSKAIKKAFKGKLLSDINPFICEKYKMLRVKIVKKLTVNSELSLMRQVFEKAIEWKKWDSENPLEKVPKFKIKKGKKPGYLTPEEVKAIRDNIDSSIKRDMVDFAYHTGWRVSEIRKLRWKDVNLDVGTAWIVDPKNGETVEIVLGDKAVEMISRQERRGPYVFCHKNGKPYRSNDSVLIRAAAKKAGIILPPRKAWHIFRRTWASMMLQDGSDVETVRELGNWKNANMVFWYAEPANSQRKKAALNRIPSLDKLQSNVINMAEIQEASS